MEPIDTFIAGFTQERITYTAIGSSYYHIPDTLKKTMEHIGRKPAHAGLFMGTLDERKKAFHPSLGLLDWLLARTQKKVVLGAKGAYLFTCGRDALKPSVLFVPEGARTQDKILVCGEDGGLLGLGRLVRLPERAGSDAVIIKNILDIGDYLRRERTHKRR